MTRPTIPPSGCKQDSDRKECPLVCRYNHFESDDEDLTIDAWELKCLECGWRDTIGFRSDEEEEAEPETDCDPTVCPFCKVDGLAPGKNPCQS